ncbi:MAG: Spy/CpxP family protein refolding chaperone [Mariprofundaceae bacterium]
MKATMTKAMMLGLGLSLCLMSAPQAQACPGHGACHSRPMHGHAMHHAPGSSLHLLHRILHRAGALGLSEAQRGRIEKLLADAEATIARLQVRAEAKASGFHDRLRAGKVDEEAMRAYAHAMGELKGEMILTRLKAAHAALAVLTREQRARLWPGKVRGHEGGKP